MASTLRLVAVNDVYANHPVRGVGGWNQLATLVRAHRTPNSIFCVNGDFLGGSALAEHFQGRHVIEVMNSMQVDMVVLGNHEFDHGAEHLEQRMEESKFMWLGSNVREKATGELFGRTIEYHMRTVQMDSGEEVKVGFFGVCTANTPRLAWPGPRVEFRAVLSEAQRVVDLLKRAGAEVIIGLTHVCLAEDRLMAKKVKGVDVILGGHEHQPITLFEGGCFLFKCGQNANWLGVVDLELCVEYDDSGVRSGVRVFPSWQMIANRHQEPDAACESIIEKYSAEKRREEAALDLDEQLAVIRNGDLPSITDVVRRGSSAFGCLIADMMQLHYKPYDCECAIINGGFIRGDTIHESDTVLTTGIIKHELPFPKHAVLTQLSGANLKLALEQQARSHPEPSGSFPHFSHALSATFHPHKPSLQRFTDVRVRGEAVQDERLYRVCITAFMAMGGDGCVAFATGRVLSHDEEKVSDVVVKGLRQFPDVDVSLLQQRMTVVDDH